MNPTATALLFTVALAACISSSPPAPAVRYFDPTPDAVADAATNGARLAVRVECAAHLGREFVVRTGPREVVFDPQHSWIGEPRALVAAAIERTAGAAGAGESAVLVEVEVFELDLQAEPKAHVRLLVHDGDARRTIDESAVAANRSPEAFAAAMSQALGRAAAGVASAPAVR